MNKSNESNWLDYVYLTGCIAYFILPIDLIPDFVAGFGYTDDIAVLAMAFKRAYSIFTQTAKERAISKSAEIFGKNFDADAAAKIVYGTFNAVDNAIDSRNQSKKNVKNDL